MNLLSVTKTVFLKLQLCFTQAQVNGNISTASRHAVWFILPEMTPLMLLTCATLIITISTLFCSFLHTY